jgi:group I intron endonuclease
MNNRSGIIYLATNLVNGKQYIGKTTKTLTKRIYQHFKLKNNYPFHKALIKYGKNMFSWKVLCECSILKLDEMEKYYITEYNTCISCGGNGYNIQEGGNGAPYGDDNPSKRPEVREKLRQLILGDKNPMKISSIKEKMIQTLTGRKLTKEHRENISSGSMGRYIPKGDKSWFSKEFLITFPDGHTETIKGLLDFCKTRGLDYEKIRYAQKKHGISSNGFRCELLK